MANALIFEAKELLQLTRGVRRYAARGTQETRKKFAWLLRMLQWQRYQERKNLLASLPVNPALSIPEETGLLKLTNTLDKKLVADAITSAKNHWQKFDLATALANRTDKSFAVDSLGKKLTPQDPILKLALNPDLVNAVGRYIGMLPVIENIMMWYSPNDKMIEGSPQYFHLDGQDVRTLQVFIFLDSVTEANGPLEVLPAAASDKLADTIGYRKTPTTKRITDEEVRAAGQTIKLTGNAGEVYIADTDRCFHQGSRAGTAPRHVMVIQYYSPFAFVLPHAWNKALPLAHLAKAADFNRWQQLVLGER